MEKDPVQVARLAAGKEAENWRFRTFVKGLLRLSDAGLDALAERLGREAEDEMDCTSCGACCRDIDVPLSEDETRRLAGLLSLPVLDFREAHMGTDDDGEPALAAEPCPFLDGRRCGVYADRPQACRDYPYIGRGVRQRMIGIIERAGTCPIVFEMLERLKDALGFHVYDEAADVQDDF